MTRAERIEKNTSICCPTCGRKLKKNIALSVDLNTNTVVANNRAVQIAPKQAELIFALHKVAPRSLLPEGIISAVWGVDAEVSEDLVRVTISNARQILKRVGYTIKNYPLSGYALRQDISSKYTVRGTKTSPAQRAVMAIDPRKHDVIAKENGVSRAFVSKLQRASGKTRYKTCAL